MDRPLARTPGRGASSNPANRYDRLSIAVEADGWAPEDDLPVLRTEVQVERPRKVITRNTSPDICFDRSINPYRGCEHGCVYCYARPSHAWLGMSPGLDFETRLIARPDAPELLRTELSKPRYYPAPLAIGTNTDPYQPVEREWQIMRRILEVLLEFRHPVAIVTKGTMIERDLDILSELAKLDLVRVGVSVTTLDAGLARLLEPRVPAPDRRLRTIARLSGAGILVRAMVSPVIPALTDHEIEAILARAQQAGARAASWIMLRLPLEVSGLFREWLAEHYPDRAARVMARLREMHGGQDYDPEFGRRMRGEGPYAEMIAQRFRVAAARLGLSEHLPEPTDSLFRVPPKPGDQLSLF
ncbi:Radical SAM domain protein [Rhodovulum sp. P5]|uniref:PA0069 family radical SAM protein n=1 Tax=Rhodovulum sp. P5 TaxID=1564506 RepID=UPI0009C2BD62|nr:PA0069 family radical SAM protein [Rhodovulum sp. P5]ARE41611.1 Radical SAM domain protein [Rhodovulum sp. P5]